MRWQAQIGYNADAALTEARTPEWRQAQRALGARGWTDGRSRGPDPPRAALSVALDRGLLSEPIRLGCTRRQGSGPAKLRTSARAGPLGLRCRALPGTLRRMEPASYDALMAQLRRGTLQFCVLALLAEERRYAFDLVRALG